MPGKILDEHDSVEYALAYSKVAKDVVYILSEFGIEISSDMFMSQIKKIHAHAIKNLENDDKTAIIQLAHRIRLISTNKAVPTIDNETQDPIEESYDFDAKFRSKIEHMLFNVVKFLIIGKDEQDLSAFIKPQQYAPFVHLIKTSKFKQNAYRQTIKNFIFKTNIVEELSDLDAEMLQEKKEEKKSTAPVEKPEKRVEKLEEKKPIPKKEAKKDSASDKSLSSIERTRKEDFEKNDTYKDLAAKDKNIKLAVDILKWLGFSEDILDNSAVKMELRHGVRARVKRIMATPEAKRVKMIWSYELDKKIDESHWTDEDVDVEDDLSVSDLKKPAKIKKKFELPDSIHYKPWDFTTNKEDRTTMFNNGKVTIQFGDEAFDKIVKSINNEKKAFVVKDVEEIKWVFTQNEIGGFFIVQQGKTDKKFLTPLDVENMLK